MLPKSTRMTNALVALLAFTSTLGCDTRPPNAGDRSEILGDGVWACAFKAKQPLTPLQLVTIIGTPDHTVPVADLAAFLTESHVSGGAAERDVESVRQSLARSQALNLVPATSRPTIADTVYIFAWNEPRSLYCDDLVGIKHEVGRYSIYYVARQDKVVGAGELSR